MSTVVCQSYRTDGVAPWIGRCLESVRAWAEGRGYAYRFADDVLLDRVPGWYREKAGGRLPVITDLARLLWARELLDQGWCRVVWLDADVLVFDPAGLTLDPSETYAFGRELWVQPDSRGRPRVRRNVHNAVCLFEPGNPMLDFYIDACRRVVGRLQGGVPPQIVGPKLLTSLHNMIGLPLIDAVGMLSPLVIGDVGAGGGPALDLLRRESPPLAAANLCSSLAGGDHDGVLLDAALMDRAVDRLLEDQILSTSTSR